ncbi:MAG TPA: flavodoxin family protein [Desulfobacteria bacterium]|nr:flavodoxin family protein [Desulfobacteria bacterium]
MQSESVYCLGLATSPRQGGNTEILLRKALEGAAKAGARTELVDINTYRFSPCIACDGCFKEGKCVVRDDMQVIYEKILAADRIILAAPIFSMGMCAQAKAMVDRTQRFWSTKYVLKRKVIPDANDRLPRKGMFISASGSNHKDVFAGALQVAKYFFLMIEAEFMGSFCYSELEEKGAVLNHQDILSEIFEAGKRLGSV